MTNTQKTLTISLTDSARAVITHARKAERIVYSAYIADHSVTLETVSEHVKALTEMAATMEPFADKKDQKRFTDKIRNGLNTHLGKVVPSKEANKSGKYVTAEGLKAESWEAFVEKAKAEWTAANEK